jgi:hypothetical protein
VVLKSDEERKRRFDEDVKHLLDSFKNRPATIRVQFIGHDEVHMLGGKMFIPPVVSCKVNHLPAFITDKVAILKVHGERGYVEGIGKWLSPDSFYIDVTPNEWGDFHEKLSSARRHGTITDF